MVGPYSVDHAAVGSLKLRSSCSFTRSQTLPVCFSLAVTFMVSTRFRLAQTRLACKERLPRATEPWNSTQTLGTYIS